MWKLQAVYDRGVYLPEPDLWLDSLRRRDLGFISHAHSDHTARHSRPALTPNTRLLLGDYLRKSDPITLEYGEPFKTPAYTMTLYPAGHCLGSAQALVESRATGERLLYTGDIKARPSPANEPIETPDCDILVMEATYGHPKYVFPDQDDVVATACRTLRSWLSKGERPVVQGYTLGKSQEILIHLLDNGFDVVVEEGIYEKALLYREAGVEFPGEFRRFTGDWPEGAALLCPPGKKSAAAVAGFRGVRTMELTGWALGGGRRWGRRGDASLPYSDHPDFNELVEYVQKARPKQVYTVNGFPDLAAHLRGLGYPAAHLDKNNPMGGGGFQMKML